MVSLLHISSGRAFWCSIHIHCYTSIVDSEWRLFVGDILYVMSEVEI